MEAHTKDAIHYCREVLPRVSRTFALNIRLLRGELGEAVRVGYLLCRVADTLEDVWPASGLPARQRFELFGQALAGRPGADARLAASVPVADGGRAASSELELVRKAPLVFSRFAALDPDRRAVVAEGVGTLAAGMLHFAERSPLRGERAYLEDDAELHRYCYSVAGCVGEMLTRLYLLSAPRLDGARTERLRSLAPSFGEGLQLTNILLDLPADLRRGRCYVPQSWLDAAGLEPAKLCDAGRAAAVADLLGRLEEMALMALDQACRYTLLLPRRHWRYRLFCAWPMLWAAASLGIVRATADFPRVESRPRLARSQVRRLAYASGFRAFSNAALERLYRRARPEPPRAALLPRS